MNEKDVVAGKVYRRPDNGRVVKALRVFISVIGTPEWTCQILEDPTGSYEPGDEVGNMGWQRYVEVPEGKWEQLNNVCECEWKRHPLYCKCPKTA